MMIIDQSVVLEQDHEYLEQNHISYLGEKCKRFIFPSLEGKVNK